MESPATLLTAPSIGYMCIVDMPVGSCSPYFLCTSMAASLISAKKSARQ